MRGVNPKASGVATQGSNLQARTKELVVYSFLTGKPVEGLKQRKCCDQILALGE